MLTVTLDARDRLLHKLVSRSLGNEQAMRFKRKSGGWKLRPGRARPTDAAIKHEGRNVLLLDEDARRGLSRMMLDVRVTESGPRLTLLRVRRKGE